ncbi:reverse transcriptase domain-containing protein [Tanacetum coccineum]|uniref:Reverse transcriptase domain-containing protein n=1 Tax=Tanacetum coccineum TaxID=301880 RepID=A0ABQ5FAY5_9ASTR
MAVWTLYTDGASSNECAGSDLILTDPEGNEITYALRFEFPTSNNESEYEALIAGLELSIKLEVHHLQVFTDSLLVTNHVKGTYEAREESMKRYLAKVRSLQERFKSFSITQIPRSKNKHVDALSKLASSSFAHLTKKVFVEVVPCRSTNIKMVNTVEETETTWMDMIISYLRDRHLPEDSVSARKIRVKAPQYSLKQGILNRKGYLTPWMRCVGLNQAQYVLQEAHFGSCGPHFGAWSITQKVARLGYFLPTMYNDATKVVNACVTCQKHALVTRKPQCDMVSISSPWPFYQWGIDLVGPFPEAPGRVKFLAIAVDYFTKWVEAAPLATITGNNILKFVRNNIVCRFGIPGIIISDNGKQFAENPFREWCSELKIKQQFTSVAHLQTNGKTEVTNRTLLQGLKTRLGLHCTPFSLVYRSEAVLPLEIGIPTYKNDGDLRLNLDLLEERRNMAALREARRGKESLTETRRAISNSRVKTPWNVCAQEPEREVDPKNVTYQQSAQV